MSRLENMILSAVGKKNYQPVKPKALARHIGIGDTQYADFRRILKDLYKQGRVEIGKNNTVRQPKAHGTVSGTFRKADGGFGFVRPNAFETGSGGQDVYIPEGYCLDAATGDVVLVKVRKNPQRRRSNPTGEIVQVIERATRLFVGTYFERDGQGFVRVDGKVFSHSIFVGDPGAKGAKTDDKVVFEMLRFPGPEDRGEGVITEILGERGKPGVDVLSIIRAYGLPDVFPEEAIQEAREAAAAFNDRDLLGREDFTKSTTITIDPPDARDFDDAISVTQDERTKHWELTVHIADVGHFAPPGGQLDQEAKRRGTSVYLPQHVIPMFPEILSNSLASLQEGKLRYVKTVVIEYTPEGAVVETRFANGAIQSDMRFAYEQIMAFLNRHPEDKEIPDSVPITQIDEKKITSEIGIMLLHMRALAMILRERRRQNGSLELDMPETQLEYDKDGNVSGAHFRKHNVSHQIVEEFMLAANEAVAQHFTDLGVKLLRRVHPAPLPTKLRAFADFARILGYDIKSATDRFALQRVLQKSHGESDMYAVHYALLRSLKQAVYSPEEDGHYALAIDNYCHFTSPIRRYPDLLVHRLLDRWLRTGNAKSDETELIALGEHCSTTERRATNAERELTKVKLLNYMNERIGTVWEVIITGVADYGFYAQAEDFPAEGLVHIDTLVDDYYYFDRDAHSLTGRKNKRTYQLGDRVKAKVVRVDLQRQQLDFRVVAIKKKKKKKKKKK